MKKENNQVVKVKNIKRSKIISYMSLVILIVLLILPPIFRTFVKEKPPEKIDTTDILNCNKEGESVNSTFLNGKPYNIMYQIVGDRTVTNNADEIDSSSQISSTGQVGAIDNSSGATETNTDQDSQIDETTEQSTDPSTLPTPSLKGGEISDETYEALLASDYIELVRVFSEVSYNEAENITTVRTDMDDIREIAFYKELLYSVERQQYYYTSKGFVCTRTTTTNVVK